MTNSLVTAATIVTRGGAQVPAMAAGTVGWSLTRGTTPHVEEITVPIPFEDARGLEGEPCSLVLEVNDQTARFDGLYVVAATRMAAPQITALRLMDRRWIWPYVHVLRRFNVRRTTGFRRIRRNSALELQDVADRVWFRPFSLKKDQEGDFARWRPREVLEEILRRVVDWERGHMNSGAAGFEIEEDAARDQLDVENLEIDDKGDAAILRVLGYLPHADLRILPDGTIRVFARSSGEEQTIIPALGGPPAKVDQGIVALVSNRARRPREIQVLFTIEAEVRFDYAETSGTQTSPGRFARRLVNVAPIPDPAMDIPKGGETVAEGTYVPIPDLALRYSQEPKPAGIVNWPAQGLLTMLRYSMLPGQDLFREMVLTGIQESDPSNDWNARWSVMLSHYRRTFRLPQEWVDRALSIRAKRVATIDPVSGGRAPAPVWCPYIVIASRRSRIRDHLASPGAPGVYGYQVNGGFNINQKLSDSIKPAPADVSVVHEDLGIVGVEFRVDPRRLYAQVVPAKWDVMASEDIIQISDTDFGHAIAVNHHTVTFGPPIVDAEWAMSIIVTLTPGAPNDERQLYMIRVRPQDIADLLPPAARRGLEDAKGPPMQVRVNPGIETARIRWHDDRMEDIERLFGVRAGEPDLSGLVVNDTDSPEGQFETGAPLKRIARSVAAAVWARLTDSVEGQFSTDVLDTGVRLPTGGRIDTIRWDIVPSGVARTEFSLMPDVPEIDPFAMLDSSTRRLINRMVVPL